MSKKQRVVEMQIVDDVTKMFGKYIKERAEDIPLVQFVNVFDTKGQVQRAVFMEVSRDMVNGKTASYSVLMKPHEFERVDNTAKFCVEAKAYFDECEYKIRSQLN